MPLLPLVIVVRTLSRTEPFASHISRLPRPVLFVAAVADRIIGRWVSS